MRHLCATRRTSTTTPSCELAALHGAGLVPLSDAASVRPLALAAITHVASFTAQQVSASLWAVGRLARVLGVVGQQHSDAHAKIVLPLAEACVILARSLKPAEAAGALWGAAALQLQDATIVAALADACAAHAARQEAGVTRWQRLPLRAATAAVVVAAARPPPPSSPPTRCVRCGEQRR